MGIKKELFLSDNYDIFVCPVCEEVAADPVVASCCEATFCNECFSGAMKCDTDSCSGCNHQFSYGIKTSLLQKQLNIIYQRLQLKCEECDQETTIGGLNEHDCPAKTFNCSKCDFNDHVPKGETHDCVVWLKNQVYRLRLERDLVKEESIRREVSLTEDKEAYKKIFEEFMARNSSIQVEGNKVNVQLHGADNLARFRPRTGLNVSIVPIEVVFNEQETTASSEVRQKIVDAIKQVGKPGFKLFQNLMRVRDVIRESTGAPWFLYEEEQMNAEAEQMRKNSNCSCSFDYDGRHYIAFERMTKKSQSQPIESAASRVRASEVSVQSNPTIDKSIPSNFPSIDTEAPSSKSRMNVSKNHDEVEFVEEYTFATKEVRERVAKVVFDLTKDGSLLSTNNRFNPFKKVMRKSEGVGRYWALLNGNQAMSISTGQHSFDPDTFCTFTFRSQLYIALKRAKSASGREQRLSNTIRTRMAELAQKLKVSEPCSLASVYESNQASSSGMKDQSKDELESEDEESDLQSVDTRKGYRCPIDYILLIR